MRRIHILYSIRHTNNFSSFAPLGAPPAGGVSTTSASNLAFPFGTGARRRLWRKRGGRSVGNRKEWAKLTTMRVPRIGGAEPHTPAAKHAKFLFEISISLKKQEKDQNKQCV